MLVSFTARELPIGRVINQAQTGSDPVEAILQIPGIRPVGRCPAVPVGTPWAP